MSLMENDIILDKLKSLKDNLKDSYQNAKIIAVHFLCGNENALESIRKSTFYAPKISEKDEEVYRILTRHISEFERENVLLGLACKWASNKSTSNRFVLRVQNVRTKPEESYKLEFTEEAITNESSIKIWQGLLKVPNSLIQELCTEQDSSAFIAAIKEQNYRKAEEYLSLFDLRRAAVFGKTISDETVINQINLFKAPDTPRPDSPFDSKYQEQKSLWVVLQGVLSTSLFCNSSAESSFWKDDEEIRVYLHKFNPKSNRAIVGVAIYPFLFNQSESESPHLFFTNIEDKLSEIKTTATTYVDASPMLFDKVSPTFNGNKSDENRADRKDQSENELKKVCKNIFPIKFQNELAFQISRWLLSLTERLKEKRHEGKSLDFWFIIGDITQFKDNRSITLKRFKELGEKGLEEEESYIVKAIEQLGIPNDEFSENECKLLLEKAARFLANEHYPWFQQGKFALMWDVSNLILNTELNSDKYKAYPYGLVSIKGTTWEQYLAQYYNKNFYLKIPNNLLVYTKSFPPDTGLMTTESNENHTQRQIFYMKDDVWVNSHYDERKDVLDVVLQKVSNDILREKLKELILRIAGNPLSGGTLIILKKNSKKPRFSKMGLPWKFSNDISDIEALMCHDGATIFKELKGEENWDFRLLLSNTSKVTKHLENIALNVNNDFALSGVGSRRWSAALAAFKIDVATVVVISRDGDITCWAVPGTNLEEAKVFDLRTGVKPEKEGKLVKEWLEEPKSFPTT